MLRPLPILLAVFLALAGCASARSADSDSRTAELLVTLRNFKSGERFELASESHTDRVAYYSDARSDAARKVQSDEIMQAFVEELDRVGFATHAQPGPAPSVAGGDVIRWGLQIDSGASQSHWLVGTGSPGQDWQDFQRCRDTFLQLYNITISFQTVQNSRGEEYFDEAAAKEADRP